MGKSVIAFGFFMMMFFSFGFVASCTDDQVMFRLYRDTNSHVAIWNHTSYSVPVCYNDLFGEAFKGSNPHKCNSETNPTNVIFWVSNYTNSHVSSTKRDGYEIPICYGDLVCSTSRNGCLTSNEVVVAKLYNEVNSHVSLPTDPNYEVSVCCKRLVSLSNSSWLNLNGESVSSVDRMDTVLMSVGGYRLDKEAISFSLKKLGGESFLDRTRSLIWNVFTKFDFTPNLEFGVTGTDTWVADKPGNIVFNTLVSNIAGSFKSKVLSVSKSEDDTPPVAKINNSYDNLKFAVNEPILFEQDSYDEDDLLSLQWDFGDNTRVQMSNYALVFKNEFNATEKNYSHGGVYKVILTALEKGSRRGQRATDSETVYIFKEGINVIPVITSPKNGVLNRSSRISFNASQSYVANCSYNGISNPNFVVGDLNCTYIQKPGVTKTSSDYNLTVSWAIDNKEIKRGNWDTGSNVNFDLYYPDTGRHIATLFLNYSD